MTKSAHIADLERLEDEIGEVLIHEVINDLTISELKRRKLHLRDEIERLRHITARETHDNRSRNTQL